MTFSQSKKFLLRWHFDGLLPFFQTLLTELRFLQLMTSFSVVIVVLKRVKRSGAKHRKQDCAKKLKIALPYLLIFA